MSNQYHTVHTTDSYDPNEALAIAVMQSFVEDIRRARTDERRLELCNQMVNSPFASYFSLEVINHIQRALEKERES